MVEQITLLWRLSSKVLHQELLELIPLSEQTRGEYICQEDLNYLKKKEIITKNLFQ